MSQLESLSLRAVNIQEEYARYSAYLACEKHEVREMVGEMWILIQRLLYPPGNLTDDTQRIYDDLVETKADLDSLRSCPVDLIDANDRKAAIITIHERLARVENVQAQLPIPRKEGEWQSQALISSLLNSCYHQIVSLDSQNDVELLRGNLSPLGELNRKLVDLLALLKAGNTYHDDSLQALMTQTKELKLNKFGHLFYESAGDLADSKPLTNQKIELANRLLLECILEIDVDKCSEIKGLVDQLEMAKEQFTQFTVQEDRTYSSYMALKLYSRLLKPFFSIIGYFETKATAMLSKINSTMMLMMQYLFGLLPAFIYNPKPSEKDIEDLQGVVETSKNLLKSKQTFPSADSVADIALVQKIDTDLNTLVKQHSREVEISTNLKKSVKQCRNLINSF